MDRALRILQKRDNSENRNKEKQKESEPAPKRKGRNKDKDDDDGIPVKPSGKVSLFDFLEDKLPNVPDRQKERNNRGEHNTVVDDKSDKNYGNRERNNSRYNARSQGPRHDRQDGLRHRNDRGHFNDHHQSSHREERKYQTQAETPPRFQKKFDEMNKHSNNQYPYKNYNQPHNQYNNRRNERNFNENKVQQQPQYPINSHSIDKIVETTANLNLMTNQQCSSEEKPPPQYQSPDQSYQKQNYQNHNMPEMQPFRRNNDVPKYQEQTYQRRQQPNGYVEQPQNTMYPNMNYMANMQGGYNNRQYGYGGRPQEFNTMRTGGPFLPGSLLGFQNAAVNEQARAMLGVAEINWKVGDRCLALYWEDNNVS